jgi:hypothetical protein
MAKVKVKEAAKIFKMTTRNIYDHIAKGNFHKDDNGLVDTDEIQAYYDKKEEKAAQESKYDLEFKKWKAEKEKTIVIKLREKLVSIDEVERGYIGRIFGLRAHLLVLSERIADEIAGKDTEYYRKIKEILDKQLMEFLQAYSTGTEPITPGVPVIDVSKITDEVVDYIVNKYQVK